MDFKKKVNKLVDECVDIPTRIRFTNINLLEIPNSDLSKEMLSTIQNGDHNELIGMKIWGMEIVEVDADELKVE